LSLRPRGSWPVVLVVLFLLVGCTPDEAAPPPAPAPEPSPTATGPAGVRAGIVFPPAAGDGDPQITQLTAAMRTLESRRPDLVSQLRPLTPDGPEFVADLGLLFVQRGTDLICLVGTDGTRVAGRLANRHPELRFCALPTRAGELPDNLQVVDVRLEELGHVAGATAAAAVDEAPVAMVVGADRLGLQRFRDGVRAGVGDADLLEWFPTSSDEALAAVEAAVAAGAGALVLDVGWQATDLLVLAEDAGLALLAPQSALASDRLQVAAALGWSVRWELALDPLVQRLVDDTTEVPASIGLAEDAFVLSPGPRGPRGALDRAVAELRDGARDAVAPTEE